MIEKYIEQILAANPNVKPDELLNWIVSEIGYYKGRIQNNMDSLEDRFGVVEGFHKAVDKSLKTKPADLMDQVKCRKGCGHCCKIYVDVSLAEAQYVLNYCDDNNITINVDYLKEQAKLLKVDDFMFSKHKRCVFLAGDDTCKVYEVRPISCRTYFVISDPELCDYSNGIKTVQAIATMEENLMGAGLFAADSETGSLSQMLLRAIEIKKGS